MGKKQPDHPEQAHRVKNNMKSSSSAKAAEMVASSLSSYGFDAELSQIGIGTFYEDSFDTNVDSDFRMALRKLQKKDSQTKLKALEELKSLIEMKTQEECVAIVSYWSKPYSKLTVDSERKIRETCQQTHEKLVQKIGKNVAPILKNIMPYWILAQADSFLSSSRVAESAFKSTFNPEKQPEVVRFAKDEILNVLYDYLIIQTAKTLSDSTLSEDEALFKYETVVCMSLRGFDLFLRYYFSNSAEKLTTNSQSGAVSSSTDSSFYSLEKIEKIFNDSKFWKFSKDSSTKIRSEFFQLISFTLDNLLINKSLVELSKNDSSLMDFRKNLKAKLVPLVFYACDEDNQSCCFYVWQSIIKSLKHFNNSDKETEDFWSLLNAKKAFIPKLIALLKNHANGNANNQNVATIYESLNFLIRNLRNLFAENNEEKLVFYKDFFIKLNDAIFRQSNIKNRANFSSDRSKMVYAMFDCLGFVLNDLIPEDSNDAQSDNTAFCFYSLSNYVLKICENYLDDQNRTYNSDLEFETRFQRFVQETIESKKNAPVLSVLFWTELNKILEEKLNTNSQSSTKVQPEEIIQTDTNVLNNFCDLFKNYWLQLQTTDQSKNLSNLVDTIFNKFFNLFNDNLNDNKKSNAKSYLKLLNKLCSNFLNLNMLNTFLNNQSNDLILDEKLKKFNEVFILNLVQNVLKDTKDNLLVDVIDLFLIINVKLLSQSPRLNENLIKQIDKYLFDNINETNQSQIEAFILNYLTNSKTNNIASAYKNILTEWLIQSEKVQSLIINQIFTNQKLFSMKDSNMLAIELVENLAKPEFINRAKVSEKLYDFFLNYINIIVMYSQNMLKENSKLLNLQEFNNYLNFCTDLLFKNSATSAIATKLIKLDNLWTLLLNSLIVKSKLQKSKVKNVLFDKIQTNLNELIKQFSNKLFDDFLSGTDTIENFKHLKLFIKTNLKTSNNHDQFILNDVLILLINQFESFLKDDKNEWMNAFYSQVIFDLDVISFKEIYNFLSNEKTFLSKFWLDKRLNYIFANKMHTLVRETYDLSYTLIESRLDWLKQIQYGLKMINKCSGTFLIPTLFKTTKSSATLVCNGEWFYLLLNAIILHKYDPNDLMNQRNPLKSTASKLKKSIQSEFKELVDSNGLKFLLDHISSDDLIFKSLIESLIINKDDLNNVSLFLTSLVDFSMNEKESSLTDCLNVFSQNLNRLLITANKNDLNDEEIKFFIYDLPFAKHSIVDNINKLNENIGHYYNLFGGLVEHQVEQLVCAMAEIKTGKSNQSFLNNLIMFNFNLDILTKYVKIYLSLLKSKNDSSLFKILNCNEATVEFLKKKLAPLLVKILNLFIELKSSIPNTTYTFFFDLSNKTEGTKSSLLNWQEFVMLDKLNQLLQLFFVDFKLQVTGRAFNYVEQLSQFLSEKQWDFILCYTAAISQYMNKLDLDFRLLTTQIFAINFFEMFSMLAKCMQFRVRDNRPGTYPKSVFSDWSGFFTKEIFDPIFCLYVRTAENYSLEQTHVLKQCLIKKISIAASAIPVERLVFNELEPKFNAMDLTTESLNQSVINLTSSLKTVFNYLVPHLKHKSNSIQVSSFKILKKLMKKISEYYSLNEQNETCSDGLSEEEKKLSILESLPSIISSVYYELNDLFADLKNHLEFNENILITTNTGDELDEECESNDYGDDEIIPKEIIVKKTESLNLNDSTNDQYIDILNISAKQISSKSASEMRQDANNKLMAYLLINNLILDMFSTENLEFKVKLVNNLREVNFNDYLMHFLFRIMPSFKNASLKLFASPSQLDEIDLEELEYDFDSLINYDYAFSFIDQISSDCSLEINNNESFLNKNVQSFACKLYKQALKSVPAMIRDWFNIQPKRISDQVDKYTRLFVSPVLLEEEIKQINRSSSLSKSPSNSILVPIVEVPSATGSATPPGPAKKTIILQDEDESSIKIRGMLSTREVVSTYKMKELNMELIIHLPINHPLGVIEVSSVRRLGVSENEWRNWLLQLTTYLTHQNGTIIQSLQIWKKNVDKKFSGVEECTICYNVINGTNYQLPKMKCRTCRKLFHSACLYKWFESSAKSTCPLCRNIF